LTRLGLYFAKKSINKAEVARKTGLSEARLSVLSSKESAKPRADEIYLIALALEIDSSEIMRFMFEGLKLK